MILWDKSARIKFPKTDQIANRAMFMKRFDYLYFQEKND
jgi:hypothetical protein